MKYLERGRDIQKDLIMCPPQPILQIHMEGCDNYRRLVLDGKEITITSYLRDATAKGSYHPPQRDKDGALWGFAYDTRLHDFFVNPLRWEPEEKEVFLKFLRFCNDYAEILNNKFKQSTGGEIQVVAHPELWESYDQHIHTEADWGNPVVA